MKFLCKNGVGYSIVFSKEAYSNVVLGTSLGGPLIQDLQDIVISFMMNFEELGDNVVHLIHALNVKLEMYYNITRLAPGRAVNELAVYVRAVGSPSSWSLSVMVEMLPPGHPRPTSTVYALH